MLEIEFLVMNLQGVKEIFGPETKNELQKSNLPHQPVPSLYALPLANGPSSMAHPLRVSYISFRTASAVKLEEKRLGELRIFS